MARNGSGTYSKVGGDAVFDTVISETYFNAQIDDMVTALTGSVAADGQTPVTGNIAMGTNKLTGLGAGSAATDSTNLGTVQAGAYANTLADTGAADAYVITPSPAITAYAAGQRFSFIAANASTGASTVNVSGLGTKAVEYQSVALTGAEIKATSTIVIEYDGTAFQMISPSNLLSATAGDVVGPASATDNSLALFDGTTGKLLKDGTDTVATIRSIPQNSQSAAYTTVLGDAGKHIYHPGADTTARVWTIDSNANVAYPVGSEITFVNDTSAGALTIDITSDTLVWAADGTTGSRTIPNVGMVTAIKMATTRWMISGTGFTAFTVATGGTITTDGNYKVHTFNSSGTFEITTLGDDAIVDYLVVAGGGGGGGGNNGGGGGGAGGYRTATGFAVTATTYTVTIGAGGAAQATQQTVGNVGNASVWGAITSVAGGNGGTHTSTSLTTGGSGGGKGTTGASPVGLGTAGQGFDGGDNETTSMGVAGGGGGASEVGGTPVNNSTGGVGGDGNSSSIDGSATVRGGGGGGGGGVGATEGAGGDGGGGIGAVASAAGTGTANKGAGGGGGGGTSVGGGAGGSGVVIIRYLFQ